MDGLFCSGCGKELGQFDDFHESDDGVILCVDNCLPDGVPEEDWLIQ